MSGALNTESAIRQYDLRGKAIALGWVLRVVQGEHSGVIGGEYVLMLKSPARRSRAGLGV